MKRKWTKSEETALLQELQSLNKSPNWEEISLTLKKIGIQKTAQQVYYRWFNNQKKAKYVLNFGKKNKFTKEEEKKLLKLSYEYAPKWKKISKHFKNRNRFDVCNHFYGIIRKSLIKACKLLRIKKGTDLLWKLKPRLYSSLLNKEIKIDIREFKKLNLEKEILKDRKRKKEANGVINEEDSKLKEEEQENKSEEDSFKIKKDEDSNFVFFTFHEFVSKLYFEDYNEIWEKITEKEIFVIKKVFVYLIEMNFRYNKEVKMSKRKIEEFFKIKPFFQLFQKRVIQSYSKSFYQNNKRFIEFPEETKKREIKEEIQKINIHKILEKQKKLSLSQIKMKKEKKIDFQTFIKSNMILRDKKQQIKQME